MTISILVSPRPCWCFVSFLARSPSVPLTLCSRFGIGIFRMALTVSDSVAAFGSPRYLSIVVAVATLVLLLLTRYIRRLLFVTPKSVPGPFLARLSRLWYLIQVRRGDWHKVILQQHRKYGEEPLWLWLLPRSNDAISY